MPETKNAPKLPGLDISGFTQNLSPENRKSVAGYEKACGKLNADVGELHRERRELLGNGRSLTFEAVEEAGARMSDRKADLEARYLRLLWQRFELLAQIEDDVAKEAAAALADEERVILEVREDFASQGVTAAGMPAGNTNSRAAERQLLERIKFEIPVLSAVENRRRTATALDQLGIVREQVPTSAGIPWEAAAASEVVVAKLAGVA